MGRTGRTINCFEASLKGVFFPVSLLALSLKTSENEGSSFFSHFHLPPFSPHHPQPIIPHFKLAPRKTIVTQPKKRSEGKERNETGNTRL